MSKFAARRALKRAGVQAALYNFELVEETSRGEHHSQTADSPQTITAVFDPGGKSLTYDLFGADVDAEMAILIRDDVAGVKDGGGEGASRIVHDGDTFVVIDADRHQQHGLFVLECERDQEADLS